MTTTVARLLAQKRELLERLERDNLGDKERAAIEELLTKIDEMLNSLDPPVLATPSDMRISFLTQRKGYAKLNPLGFIFSASF